MDIACIDIDRPSGHPAARHVTSPRAQPQGGRPEVTLNARASASRAARIALAGVIISAATTNPLLAAGPPPQASAAFDQYVAQAEARIQREESAADTFLGLGAFPAPSTDAIESRLRRGEIVVSSGGITPVHVPGGLVHHWVGIVVIPQATIAQLFDILQNYNQMARYYSPDVAASRLLKRHGDDFQFSMRFREHKIITVMLDGLYDVRYGQLDPGHQFSVSHSMQMVEVSDDRDTAEADVSGPSDSTEPTRGTDHGFLWRTNAYWRFEQATDGVFVEFESISLSRDVPTGWGWLIEPFIREIPRESLVFTLRATRKAVLADSASSAGASQIELQHRP